MKTGRIVLRGLLLLLPFAALEIVLRILGIGGSIIYVEHPIYGYRPKPSQRFSTLRHPIVINPDGFRGPVNQSRILCLGCSITYGCAFVADEDTFPARLGALNAGVNGWGLQNMAKFLPFVPTNKYEIVLLIIPTGLATRPFTTLRAGLISTNRRMIFRIEYLFRYLWYGVLRVGYRPYPATLEECQANIAAMEEIWNYTSAHNKKLYTVFLKCEPEAMGKPVENTRYREMMEKKAAELGIPFFTASPETNHHAMYHDGAHLSPAGHAWLADEIRKNFPLDPNG